MAADRGKKTATRSEDSGPAGHKSAAVESTAATRTQQARPVRGPARKGKGPAGKGKGGTGAKTGANKKSAAATSESDSDHKDDEDVTEAQEREADFWQDIVAASYRSRRARGDWRND